ncbi:MAG: hypothetical protein A2W31_05515 [Planctomycetes bacterium RBG_16_64_10]|nr:MAG: hypothetical protein A2W31_05515 [Planctomycetes bacterium RBG_16_64_10]
MPVVGFAGRLGSVTKTTRNAPTAFQLLVWLCGTDMGTTIGPASPASTLFRSSQVAAAGRWAGPQTPPATARDYAQRVQQTLGRPAWVGALRIPGTDQYVAALDQAVRQALAGTQSPADALRDAAQAWQAITHRLGTDAQRAAYTHSLGLEFQSP